MEIQAIEVNGIKALKFGEDGWPKFVHNHGIGEVGDGSWDDLWKVRVHGPIKRSSSDKLSSLKYDIANLKIQFYCPQKTTKYHTVEWMDQFLDGIKPDVNEPVFLAGYSFGGGGCIKYGMRPQKHNVVGMAVAAPGMYSLSEGSVLNMRMPVSIFHCKDDPTVKFSISENLVAAMKEAGLSPAFMVYPVGKHWADDKMSHPSSGIYSQYLSLLKKTYEQGVQEGIEQGKKMVHDELTPIFDQLIKIFKQ